MFKNTVEHSDSVDWDTAQSTEMLIGTVVLVACFAVVCLFMVAAS